MFVQYKNPDIEKRKELIYQIKGERPMVKFADDIKISSPNVKVSAATLSRAINSDSPMNIDMLEAIAKVTEDANKTLQDLADANGMRTQEEDKQLNQRSTAERRRARLANMDRTATQILESEIINRGFPVRLLSGLFNGASLHGYLYQIDRMFPRNYNFGFSVSGLNPGTWKFALNSLELPENSAQGPIDAHVGHFINRIASVLASDSMESDLYESEKYSFVFVDKKLYDAFLRKLSEHDYRVNGLMTAILLDLESRRVVKEEQLKRYDEEEQGSFFNKPVADTGSDTDLSDPYIIIDDEGGI